MLYVLAPPGKPEPPLAPPLLAVGAALPLSLPFAFFLKSQSQCEALRYQNRAQTVLPVAPWRPQTNSTVAQRSLPEIHRSRHQVSYRYHFHL